MTENEVKAIKWMKCVKDDAVVTLDHIAKNEPNVSPMLYARRKEKAETIINGFEELEQYRAIGTVEECREAIERQMAKKPIPIDYKKYMNTVKNAIFLRGAFWCPNCNRVVRSGDYCNDCGQAIDWSETD